MNQVTLLILDFIMSTFPAVGFAMLFAVPKRYLIYVAFGGGIAHLSRTIFMTGFDFGIVVATFLSSIIISLIFIYVGPKLKVPRPVFTVASIIPIIPGKYAYTTLLSIIYLHNYDTDYTKYVEQFFQNGMTTLAVMLAMGLGIALPPLFFYRNRPVV